MASTSDAAAASGTHAPDLLETGTVPLSSTSGSADMVTTTAVFEEDATTNKRVLQLLDTAGVAYRTLTHAPTATSEEVGGMRRASPGRSFINAIAVCPRTRCRVGFWSESHV